MKKIVLSLGLALTQLALIPAHANPAGAVSNLKCNT